MNEQKIAPVLSDEDIEEITGWHTSNAGVRARHDVELVRRVEQILLARVGSMTGAETRPDEHVYWADWYSKDAPDESEVKPIDMARHAWLAGIRFADLFPKQAVLARDGAVRDQALEEAAAICASVDNYANPMTASDCVDAIRALKGTPATAVTLTDDFRNGIRAAADHLMYTAANSDDGAWAGILNTYAADILELSPDDANEWKAIGQAYTEGFEAGKRLVPQPSSNPGPLAAVAAEYNEWIRYHAAGNGDFDDFLKMVNERAAIAASKEGASHG